jgi:hypothetical protein
MAPHYSEKVAARKRYLIDSLGLGCMQSTWYKDHLSTKSHATPRIRTLCLRAHQGASTLRGTTAAPSQLHEPPAPSAGISWSFEPRCSYRCQFACFIFSEPPFCFHSERLRRSLFSADYDPSTNSSWRRLLFFDNSRRQNGSASRSVLLSTSLSPKPNFIRTHSDGSNGANARTWQLRHRGTEPVRRA